MATPTAPKSEHGEEARAFLQKRVALFWKVLFFITMLSVVFGSFALIASPGIDHLLTIISALHSGLFWQLCARGERSIRFSRLMEAGGLGINLTLGAFLGRYFSAEFAVAESIASSEGMVMSDGFISMLLVAGTTMLVAIRAAIIPSQPRRTVILTTLIGLPIIVVPMFIVPAENGLLAWRASEATPFPGLAIAMMWLFTVITCTIISWVIYGLRAEVREAKRLGQYTLESKLGEGGMGEVYRARHGMMRRPTAIKLLRAGIADENNISRFEREVQQTARLTHPNTITIFDYGRTDDGVFYYAMELLEGATLQEVVEVDGAQAASRVVHVLTMACGALSEAHAVGLIHRDLKPANIMLCTQGGRRDVAKVLDFGLVKQLDVDGDATLTGANTITGTPQYMAPESILDPNAVDARSDIYALGAVAYFLLTGTAVFGGKTIVEVCGQHLHEQPEPPSSRVSSLTSDLEAVVLACLEKDPSLRPQSAAELGERLLGCKIPSWQESDVDTWWAEHEAALGMGAQASELALGDTVAVRLHSANADS
ncbi:MAG: hypothetical protein ACI9KE_000578 [Polyangiales bacterium]